MITKENLKKEIDKVQNEYLDVLYKIIQVFENKPELGRFISEHSLAAKQQTDKHEWLSFVNETYGCLADDPIKRGEQGSFEIRETIQ